MGSRAAEVRKGPPCFHLLKSPFCGASLGAWSRKETPTHNSGPAHLAEVQESLPHLLHPLTCVFQAFVARARPVGEAPTLGGERPASRGHSVHVGSPSLPSPDVSDSLPRAVLLSLLLCLPLCCPPCCCDRHGALETSPSTLTFFSILRWAMYRTALIQMAV